MNEKRVMNDVMGFMFGLMGILVLLYPDRSPVATQMYIFGSIMILIKNFLDTISQSPRSGVRQANKPTTPRPPIPQPKRILVEEKDNDN